MTEDLAARVSEEADPWSRLEGENDKEFGAFQNFRDQGPLRTVANTGRYLMELQILEDYAREQRIASHTGKEVPPSLTEEQILERMAGMPSSTATNIAYGYAKKHFWKERASLYDDYLDTKRVKATENEVKEMCKRHISIAGVMQNKALRRFQQMEDGELTPKNVLDFLVEGIKLERLAREQSTDNVQFSKKAKKMSDANETPEEVDLNLTGAKDMLRGRIKQIKRQREKSEEALEELRQQNEPERS